MSATATDTQCKFSAKNEQLQIAIKPAVEVATKGLTKGIDTENLIHINAEKSEITLTAFGGKLAISLTVSDFAYSDLDYKCQEEGELTVNALDFIASIDSFKPEERLNIYVDKNKLCISPESDSEEVQSISLNASDINIPSVSKKVTKEISIDRQLLLKGIDKVAWAAGVEEHKPNYFYWQLLASKKTARFVAGTGGRFSIFDLKGDAIVKCDNKTEFLIHKDQTPPIVSILNAIEPAVDKDDQVIIRHCDRDGDAPEQISLSTDGMTLIIVGFDSTIKYPNMDKFLDPAKPYKFKTRVSDWEYPVKGFMAIWSAEIKKNLDSHDVTFEPLYDKGHVLLTSETTHKSKRKIPIEDVILRENEDVNLAFTCSAMYLKEIFLKNSKEDSLEIEYFDNTNKPLVVNSQEKDNGNGVKEHLKMLIAPIRS